MHSRAQMQRNEKVFRAHRALGLFYGVTAMTSLLGLLVQAMSARTGTASAATSLAIVALIMGGLAALHLVAAKGARAGKQWARTMSRIIAVVLLIGFPLGTLIGIYLLINTWSPWSAEIPPTVVKRGDLQGILKYSFGTFCILAFAGIGLVACVLWPWLHPPERHFTHGTFESLIKIGATKQELLRDARLQVNAAGVPWIAATQADPAQVELLLKSDTWGLEAGLDTCRGSGSCPATFIHFDNQVVRDVEVTCRACD